jgi:hypothetical protein
MEGVMFTKSCILLFLICLAVNPLTAQVDRATLNGTVTDPSGALVVGAKVEAILTGTEEHREALTNNAGIYRLPGMAVGRYTIAFSHIGFQTVRYEEVELRVGQIVTLDAQMQLLNLA